MIYPVHILIRLIMSLVVFPPT